MLKQSRGLLQHVLHKTTCGLELLKPRCWTLLILSFEEVEMMQRVLGLHLPLHRRKQKSVPEELQEVTAEETFFLLNLAPRSLRFDKMFCLIWCLFCRGLPEHEREAGREASRSIHSTWGSMRTTLNSSFEQTFPNKKNKYKKTWSALSIYVATYCSTSYTDALSLKMCRPFAGIWTGNAWVTLYSNL